LQPARALTSPRTYYRKRALVRRTASGRTYPYNLRFPGQYYQVETGLNQNVNRDYDPLTDKYVESDLIGLQGGSYSTYAYANGNPLRNNDPLGLEASSFPQPPQPLPVTNVQTCGGDKPHCEELAKIDDATCGAIAQRRGKAAGRACYESATQRYAACLRGQPLPPLNTWNNFAPVPNPTPIPLLPITPAPVPVLPLFPQPAPIAVLP
jgi:RHS repeat-associated protein